MSYKLAFASFSLGSVAAGHILEHKLEAAFRHGYSGVEIDYEDLQAIASRWPHQDPKSRDLKAATYISGLCQEHDISIVCLQSFVNIGGLIDRDEHQRRIQELDHWVKLCHFLGTDLIQIPSSFLSTDQHVENIVAHVKDFQQIADIGLAAQPPVRFAFEALCWGPQCQTWEESWKIVKLVNRSNFGLCLDTFHITGKIWADPAVASGLVPNGETVLGESLARLIQEVDISKVFYVQVQDGEKLLQPLVTGHPLYEHDQDARRIWQRNCRLFYRETDRGAYLPIRDVVEAIFKGLKYKGYVSFEIFHSRIHHTQEEVIEELAKRGANAWKRLIVDIEEM